MDKTLYIYKASAGSGKTFTLAVEYIKLLIANPKAYRHTLAVTFTNKATGEMKERILGSLYGVANALEEAHDYFLKISAAFPTMSEQELRARAREALHLMLHDYGHFRIQTIDAFFQSILRGMAKELELSGDLEILIEDDELLSNTVDLLIKRLTPTSQETAWLVEYVEEYLENDRGWNVRHAIKEFSRNILKEEYQQKGDNLRKQIYENNGALLTEYRNTLAAIEREIKEKAKSIADRQGATQEEKAKSSVASAVTTVGRFIVIVMKVLLGLLLFPITFAIFGLLLSLVVITIGVGDLFITDIGNFAGLVDAANEVGVPLMAFSLLLVLVPIIYIGYLFITLLINKKPRWWVLFVTILAWIILLIGTIFAGIDYAENRSFASFSSDSEVERIMKKGDEMSLSRQIMEELNEELDDEEKALIQQLLNDNNAKSIDK